MPIEMLRNHNTKSHGITQMQNNRKKKHSNRIAKRVHAFDFIGTLCVKLNRIRRENCTQYAFESNSKFQSLLIATIKHIRTETCHE